MLVLYLVWGKNKKKKKKNARNISDLVVCSRSSKHCILIELTCPNDENIDIRRKEKLDKYAHLAYVKNDSWKIHNLTIEVGAKGFLNT